MGMEPVCSIHFPCYLVEEIHTVQLLDMLHATYISNPVKHKWLQAYLPTRFKTGKEYIIGTNVQNFSTWGTEVEIIALAQLSGFGIYVFTEHNWLQYSHCIDNGEDEKSEGAFYLSNESGGHFDPVFNA